MRASARGDVEQRRIRDAEIREVVGRFFTRYGREHRAEAWDLTSARFYETCVGKLIRAERRRAVRLVLAEQSRLLCEARAAKKDRRMVTEACALYGVKLCDRITIALTGRRGRGKGKQG